MSAPPTKIAARTLVHFSTAIRCLSSILAFFLVLLGDSIELHEASTDAEQDPNETEPRCSVQLVVEPMSPKVSEGDRYAKENPDVAVLRHRLHQLFRVGVDS